MIAPIKEAPQRVFLNREEVLKGRKRYWFIRRTQDLIVSSFGLLLLWPLLLVICLVIWIDSPGASPIFVQERVGRDGKTFRFYKFRTMVPDAEAKLEALLNQNEMTGPAFKMKNDPRITRVGRILRKTSLDEVPQLWNILRGEMSIVGPRPPLPREVAEYGEYEMQRLLVTPGLTCYWQIQPERNKISFEKWMELDVKYIQDSIQKNSFLTDWKIILATAKTVIGMNGE